MGWGTEVPGENCVAASVALPSGPGRLTLVSMPPRGASAGGAVRSERPGQLRPSPLTLGLTLGVGRELGRAGHGLQCSVVPAAAWWPTLPTVGPALGDLSPAAVTLGSCLSL